MKDPAVSEHFFGRLFHSEGQPGTLLLEALAGLPSNDDVLAWIDLVDPSPELLSQVWKACALPPAALAFLHAGTMPEVGQQGLHFWVRCVAAKPRGEDGKVSGAVLTCVAGNNRVVTVRRDAIAFLEEMREGQACDAALGALSAESFVATLLDRLLASYFDAVGDYELAIERLEVDLLGTRSRDCLQELQGLRRWASRLRRMLAPHRNVFAVMARPDFRPDEGTAADQHFVALDTRFERAMDMVEHARELVIGSFELFSSKTALRTNDAMHVLTFVTVVTGLLATLVGALGMNFQASFFETRDTGFWVAVAGLGLFAAAATLLGRQRRWF